MAKPFECKGIERTAADGSLEAAGAQWVEESAWRHSKGHAYLIAIPILVICYIAGILLAFAGNGLLLLIAIGMTIFLWNFAKGDLPRRSVVFERDGTIRVANGIPMMKKKNQISTLRLKQQDVANIEIGQNSSGMPNDWTQTVKLVSRMGETVTVSHRLSGEEAREVVVLLTWAIKSMRESLGAGAGGAVRAQVGQARPLID
jgi:hypothetical protein